MKRLNAEAQRMSAETVKLEAEGRRFRHSTIIDVAKLILAGFVAAVAAGAGIKLVQAFGWL